MPIVKAALSCLTTALLSVSAGALAAPFQAARTIDGAPFDPAGHVTIVHYWATWCAPCRAEMPILDAYYRKHHGQGLEMVAISIEEGVSSAKLRGAAGKFAFPLARIDDVKMPRRDIPVSIPVNRIYDKSGRLVFQSKADGRTITDMATLEKVVTPLLAQR
ncbi:MAG TPA: TlpA disulfide reductase family protein [Sphingomicrobium sp.]|jgi:thiol-disulfide isomerase/thioredoxin